MMSTCEVSVITSREFARPTMAKALEASAHWLHHNQAEVRLLAVTVAQDQDPSLYTLSRVTLFVEYM